MTKMTPTSLLDPAFGHTAYGATFSECRRWRYTLWRRWSAFSEDESLAVWLCLNPSTASEHKNDPTVTRCIEFSKSWGYTGMVMLNLFGYRATDPKEMKRYQEPVGDQNDAAIIEVSQYAKALICGWGNHGSHQDRDLRVLSKLRRAKVKPMCLVVTGKGQPQHPLYVKASKQPIPFSGRNDGRRKVSALQKKVG